MDEQPTPVIQVSKYNEASLQIMRLHQWWIKAELYANGGKLIKWKFILDSIWRELYADVIKNKVKTKDWIKENKSLKGGIAKSKKTSDLYNSLDDRHLFLKDVQQEVGKGGTYEYADDEDAE